MALNDETEAVFKSVRGEEIDPVSGNEVPLGAEPEEVRDDIDAKLSEGEYVVPADVVNFFGVKFFEDLRAEAKMGFQQMESNGRIGGEPVAVEGSEEQLPFDVNELELIDDGEMPMNKGGYVTGYNEGGYNASLPEDFNSIDFDKLFGGADALPEAEITSSQNYRDPVSGVTKMLTFINGQPNSEAQDFISRGYVPYTSEITTSPITDTTASGKSRKDNRENLEATMLASGQTASGQTDASGSIVPSSSFRDMELSDLINYSSNLVDGVGSKISKGLGAINPMLGVATKIGKRAMEYSIAKDLERRYDEATTDAERETINSAFMDVTKGGRNSGIVGQLKGSITKGGGLLGGGGTLNDVDGDNRVGFGDTWLGDFLGFDSGGGMGIDGPNASASFHGARKTGGTGRKSVSNLGTKRTYSGGSYSDSKSSKNKPAPIVTKPKISTSDRKGRDSVAVAAKPRRSKVVGRDGKSIKTGSGGTVKGRIIK
tara:strand:- start:18 stop:1475 length:1458 start_codon:yes stop_codon:yes gene_type:complete